LHHQYHLPILKQMMLYNFLGQMMTLKTHQNQLTTRERKRLNLI
uniref:Uncharacterized protein n=1 Tax=Solanum lycopersicum TaxID=4081 RepID=A0A3Q7IX89_SOLLC